MVAPNLHSSFLKFGRLQSRPINFSASQDVADKFILSVCSIDFISFPVPIVWT